MTPHVSSRPGRAWPAVLMMSIVGIAGAGAAEPPAGAVRLSLANAPFVLRDGRTARANVLDIRFATDSVELDAVGSEELQALSRAMGPACIRSVQVIGHADAATVADSTSGIIQARARADMVAAMLEHGGIQPRQIARLWAAPREDGTLGVTVWAFLDGMRPECLLASPQPTALPGLAASPSPAGEGAGGIEPIEGQFASAPGPGGLPPGDLPAKETPRPTAVEPARALSLDLVAASPAAPPHLAAASPAARAPIPLPKPRLDRTAAIGIGIDAGDQPLPREPHAQPVSLAFANNSSYLDPTAMRALDRLAREAGPGRTCRLELQATVASVGTDPAYARWLATRRIARVEEALRSRLPGRTLAFEYKLRERDDSRHVRVMPRLSSGCQMAASSVGKVARRS